MEFVIQTYESALDTAFAKDYISDLDAAFYLAGCTEDDDNVIRSGIDKSILHPGTVRELYDIIKNWVKTYINVPNVANNAPFLWYIEQAFTREAPHVEYDLIRVACVKTENRRIKIIGEYPELAKNLRLIPSQSQSCKTRSRNTPIRRQKLEKFVKHLIENGTYDTFSKFSHAITNEFRYEGGDKPEDHETYNEYAEIKRVYGIFSRKNVKNGEGNKICKVHFSFVNSPGETIPQRPMSLSSFKSIFDTVRGCINKSIESIGGN